MLTMRILTFLFVITLPTLTFEGLVAGGKREAAADTDITVDENDWPW